MRRGLRAGCGVVVRSRWVPAPASVARPRRDYEEPVLSIGRPLVVSLVEGGKYLWNSIFLYWMKGDAADCPDAEGAAGGPSKTPRQDSSSKEMQSDSACDAAPNAPAPDEGSGSNNRISISQSTRVNITQTTHKQQPERSQQAPEADQGAGTAARPEGGRRLPVRRPRPAAPGRRLDPDWVCGPPLLLLLEMYVCMYKWAHSRSQEQQWPRWPRRKVSAAGRAAEGLLSGPLVLPGATLRLSLGIPPERTFRGLSLVYNSPKVFVEPQQYRSEELILAREGTDSRGTAALPGSPSVEEFYYALTNIFEARVRREEKPFGKVHFTLDHFRVNGHSILKEQKITVETGPDDPVHIFVTHYPTVGAEGTADVGFTDAPVLDPCPLPGPRCFSRVA
eukprot:TRINITY_DN10588_c0_g1_i2.p1 TRINITY_DN10588_c0_g1~~TRINITY_DN10588_c0_g1_i2.p1  ORF type:complete len:423 (+),score=63.36 TRINITY_DN10588_c0_g1_i2:94-1269(+)